MSCKVSGLSRVGLDFKTQENGVNLFFELKSFGIVHLWITEPWKNFEVQKHGENKVNSEACNPCPAGKKKLTRGAYHIFGEEMSEKEEREEKKMGDWLSFGVLQFICMFLIVCSLIFIFLYDEIVGLLFVASPLLLYNDALIMSMVSCPFTKCSWHCFL